MGTRPQHGSNLEQAQTNQDNNRLNFLTRPKFPPLTAPGPTGERPEHLELALSEAGYRSRKRLLKALDVLTAQWAVGGITDHAAWMLDTQLIWLRKQPATDMPEDGKSCVQNR